MSRIILALLAFLVFVGCSPSGVTKEQRDKAIAIVKEGTWDTWDYDWAGTEAVFARALGVHSMRYSVSRTDGETDPDVLVVQLDITDESVNKSAILEWDVNLNSSAVDIRAAKIGDKDQKGKSFSDVLGRVDPLLSFGKGLRRKKGISRSAPSEPRSAVSSWSSSRRKHLSERGKDWLCCAPSRKDLRPSLLAEEERWMSWETKVDSGNSSPSYSKSTSSCRSERAGTCERTV